MIITPKQRFRCLRPLCCPCGPLSPCLLVLAAHSLASLALLGLSCLLISDTEAALETVTTAIDTKDRLLQRSEFYGNVQDNVLNIPTLYASIPIIVNVVFLLSNMFAVTGIILRSRQLLLPWLGLYLTRILFTASLAIYVVHLMPIEWFKAILALVVTPIIVLESALWTVILRFYTRLRAYQKKNAVVSRRAPSAKPAGLQSQASVTGSDDISTTVGMDELAISPPHLAWDPEYLLELDPRYVGEEQMEEEVEWDSRDEEDEETYYQSDEYTDQDVRGADTETVFTESDGEFLDRRRGDETDDGELTAIEERETDFDTEREEEEEHYKSPGIPRPVLRSQSPPPVYAMEGTTTMSSNA